MSLSVTAYGDNAQVPGISAFSYNPDQLIAGNLKIVTDTVLITGGAALKRGSVLGVIVDGSAASAAKSGGNTGTGTFVLDGSNPELINVEPGIYTLRCIAAATNGGTFRLENPKGLVLGDFNLPGSAGGAVTIGERIKGVLTDGGTDFVVGDGFDITVAAGSGSYKLAVAAAIDGSQTPITILLDDVDATGGDVYGPIALTGEFNGNALILGTGITLAAAKAALAARPIFVKSSVSAADPA